MKQPLFILSVSMLVAAGVLSAPAQALMLKKQTSAEKIKDPNKKICEKIYETGSRLRYSSICMTAQEWADQRTDHRNDVERAQKNVGIERFE